MNNCLCCGKPLLDNETDWHKSCIKSFFGTVTLPTIDNENFESIFLDSKNKEAIITGVQKKLSLTLKKNGKNSRLTLVDYPSGYILKPASNQFKQLPENEWLTMYLANLCNLETIPFALIRLNDKSLAYITKRIDRKGYNKIAMEDFCQLGEVLTENKYRSSYEKVGRILEKYSDNIGVDYYKLFNIILFSFIVGNSDMHLKNFSLYQKKGKYIFSPSYDLVNTLIIKEDSEEVALTLEGKKRNLNKVNFFNLAKKYHLNETQVNRIFNNFERKYKLILDTINNSMLDKSLRDSYIKIVDDRYKRLF